MELNEQTVLLQTIQFSINTQFEWQTVLFDPGAIFPGQSGPESDGNEGVLHIPQSASDIEAPSLDCLVSYPEHLLGESYPFCRDAVGVFYGPANWAILWM